MFLTLVASICKNFVPRNPSSATTHGLCGFTNMRFYEFDFMLFAAAFLPTGALETNNDFQEKCLAFKPEKYVNNSTLEVLEYVPAGTNLSFPDNPTTCNRPSQVIYADLCRIALHIPTSNRSNIVFEAWFPSNWTGRLLGTGNGGVDGCERYTPQPMTRIKWSLRSYRYPVRRPILRHFPRVCDCRLKQWSQWHHSNCDVPQPRC